MGKKKEKTIRFLAILKTNLSDKKIVEEMEKMMENFNKNNKNTFFSTYGVNKLVYKKGKFPKEINLLEKMDGIRI